MKTGITVTLIYTYFSQIYHTIDLLLTFYNSIIEFFFFFGHNFTITYLPVFSLQLHYWGTKIITIWNPFSTKTAFFFSFVLLDLIKYNNYDRRLAHRSTLNYTTTPSKNRDANVTVFCNRSRFRARRGAGEEKRSAWRPPNQLTDCERERETSPLISRNSNNVDDRTWNNKISKSSSYQLLYIANNASRRLALRFHTVFNTRKYHSFRKFIELLHFRLRII